MPYFDHRQPNRFIDHRQRVVDQFGTFGGGSVPPEPPVVSALIQAFIIGCVILVLCSIVMAG
jgi:hypothetical protein